MRRTKIVCTIGPASEQVETLQEMINSGMNVARLNFSHGDHDEHLQRIKNIRTAMKNCGKKVALLLDTKGPEIRIGSVEPDTVVLEKGQKFVLTTEEITGGKEKVSVSYKGLPQDVKRGDKILIDDGLIELQVMETTSQEIICTVLNTGEISSRKGVNVPGVHVNLPAITEKDVKDIVFGIEQEVDFVAASFIRTASDVLEIRRLLEEHNSDIHIIAKIENRAGVDNIDDILQVADGIMVARGDLGVEIPSEEVPLVQKSIIQKCNKLGKPVITATQMLDSMIRNPRPTRAEASDVANAIFDGTDAIMLSGETAKGKYPLEAVKTMDRIAQKAEDALNYEEILYSKPQKQKTITDSISRATCDAALDLDAEAIITPTASGSTARMVSKYRPKSIICAATPDERVANKLCLVWGVYPVVVNKTNGTDEMITEAVQKTLDANYIQLGALVVVTAGVPAGVPGTTNLMKVHVVGEVIVRGTGAGPGTVSGKVKIAKNAAEANEKMDKGDILVTLGTDRDYISAMEKAAAVITEEGGLTSHAAVVGLNLGIPVIVGAKDAMKLLEEGSTITVDGVRGLIYKGIAKAL
ncbi:MAG: pyruvate kinase [Clostridia bacterium]|jgi:pyruvate kinase|nr:pyk [Clostridiales bacterium]MDK2985377.1 pyruvate kinase [Clostridia bacterium]